MTNADAFKRAIQTIVDTPKTRTWVSFDARALLKSPDARPHLIEAFRRDAVRSAHHRHELAALLAAHPHLDALPTFAALTLDSRKKVRTIAITAITTLANEGHAQAAIRELAPHLSARTKSLRKRAISALQALPPSDARSAAAATALEGEKVQALRDLLTEIAAPPPEPLTGQEDWLAIRDATPLPTGDTLDALAFRSPRDRRATLSRLLQEDAPRALATLRHLVSDKLHSDPWRRLWREGLELLLSKQHVPTSTLPWIITCALHDYAAHTSRYSHDPAHTEALLQPLHRLPDTAHAARVLLDRLQHDTLVHPHLPIAWCCENLPEPRPDALLDVLLEHATSSSAPVRREATQRLSDLGQDALPGLYALLRARKRDARLGAAQALEAIPHPDSRQPLLDALDKEKSRDVADALTRALEACDPILDADPAPPTPERDAELDARLARRAPPKLPRLMRAPLPGLRFRTGATLSDDAQRWILAMIAQEGPEQHSDALATIARERLQPATCHALLEALRQRYDPRRDKKDRRWLYFARAILASDAQIEDIGRRLDDDAFGGQFTYATYGLQILARHQSPTALFWMRHAATRAGHNDLATHAEARFFERPPEERLRIERRADAGAPRAGLDARGERSLSYAGHTLTARLEPSGAVTLLEDGAPRSRAPRGASDADKAALEDLRRELRFARRHLALRLEDAMTTGRAWAPPIWRAIFLEHPVGLLLGKGLLFAVDDHTHTVLTDEGELLDLEGEPVDATAATRITLPHRLDLSDDLREAASTLLADLELAPAIEQLHRAVHTLEPGAQPWRALFEQADAQDASALRRRLRARGFRAAPIQSIANFYRAYGDVIVRLGCPRDYSQPTLEAIRPAHLGFRRLPGWIPIAPHKAPPRIVSETLRLLHQLFPPQKNDGD